MRDEVITCDRCGIKSTEYGIKFITGISAKVGGFGAAQTDYGAGKDLCVECYGKLVLAVSNSLKKEVK
jgi:hypothetical protein